MRQIAFLFLLLPVSVAAQEGCELFNLQDLAAENLALHDSIAQFSVDTVILQPDGSLEIQLSNGTAFILILGCTDPAFTEYNASANTDDDSCSTLVVEGCTDPAFTEYNASANTDDGSCAIAVVNGCTDPAYTEYDASANTDDGSCTALIDHSCLPPNIDGYDYDVVQIGDQCWFAENLRTTLYADGSAISEVTDDATWAGLSSGARCDYGNDASNVSTYGRLYNWHAATDASGLCPSGWHVPTDGEWTDLENYIASQGFAGTEGTALKSTSGWYDGGIIGGDGTDDFGFSAPPGGVRYEDGAFFGASLGQGGYGGYWWSSSPNGDDAWNRVLYYELPSVYRDPIPHEAGLSVRCVKDAPVLGCTDPAYDEYNPSANNDDGSCTTLAPTCTDVAMDGYTYSVVEIGDQCWFSENLRTTTYSDGTAIPEVTDGGTWNGLTTGARCAYDNDATNVATYGRLYNWHAVDDPRDLCPSGWHVPTDGDWTELKDYITTQGFTGTEGTALKSDYGWSGGANGTNALGFSALPGGRRNPSGLFYVLGERSYWWSSSLNGIEAWSREINSHSEGIARNDYKKITGYSVRCLKD